MAPAGAITNLDANLIQLLRDFAVPSSRSEPVNVELKREFDNSKRSWLELLPHVVAMANTGGGTLVFGVDKDGNRTGINASLLQAFDPGNVSNKLCSFTSARVSTSYQELLFEGNLFGFMEISASDRLVVFDSDGNYQSPDGKPGRAFIAGVVYTRVPGSTRAAQQADLDSLIDRLVQVKISRILARIEHVAHAPLESDLIMSRVEDRSRGVIIEKSTPVRIVPESNNRTLQLTPLNVQVVADDSDSISVSEILDSRMPFTSVDAELQTQLRLWRQSDINHRVSRSFLCKLYLHRRDVTISPEAAEMCFISAGYNRGYPMFWASQMDRQKLRTLIDRELVHSKSRMTETLPFAVCVFLWKDRQILSKPSSKTRIRLKARNIVSNLLNFSSYSEFVSGARRGGTMFDVDGRQQSITSLLANRAMAESVFERLVELDYQGKCNDKLRSFAHRLDVIVHAETS